MDRTLLKKAAIQSVALMLAVITLSYAFHQYRLVTISAKDSVNSEELLTSDQDSGSSKTDLHTSKDGKPSDIINVDSNTDNASITELLSSIDPKIKNQLGEKYLIIKKPKGTDISIHLDDLYVNKSIRVELTGLSDASINDSFVGRVNKDQIFYDEPEFKEIITPNTDKSSNSNEPVITKDYGNDIVHGISVTTQLDDATKLYTADLMIELDSVYAQIVYNDSAYYFIALKKPKEVYDKVLVIDAGHGGKDGGALSQGHQYCEKNINLDILLKLKELLDKENIKVYYTRTEDTTVFLRPRVTLANEVDCDFFISIHSNASDASWPNGTEVLYYDKSSKGVKNKDLGQIFLGGLDKLIPLRNRGLVQEHNDAVFILDKATVPAILIEVGYVTNNNDMNYLKEPENQETIAQGIYNGIMQAYKKYPELIGKQEETK